jgi:hypothetical protein
MARTLRNNSKASNSWASNTPKCALVEALAAVVAVVLEARAVWAVLAVQVVLEVRLVPVRLVLRLLPVVRAA